MCQLRSRLSIVSWAGIAVLALAACVKQTSRAPKGFNELHKGVGDVVRLAGADLWVPPGWAPYQSQSGGTDPTLILLPADTADPSVIKLSLLDAEALGYPPAGRSAPAVSTAQSRPGLLALLQKLPGFSDIGPDILEVPGGRIEVHSYLSEETLGAGGHVALRWRLYLLPAESHIYALACAAPVDRFDDTRALFDRVAGQLQVKRPRWTAALAPAAAATPATTPAAHHVTWRVRKGETLGTIAALLTGSVANYRALAEASKLANPDAVFAGQELRIPESLLTEKGRKALADPAAFPPPAEKAPAKEGVPPETATENGAGATEASPTAADAAAAGAAAEPEASAAPTATPGVAGESTATPEVPAPTAPPQAEETPTSGGRSRVAVAVPGAADGAEALPLLAEPAWEATVLKRLKQGQILDYVTGKEGWIQVRDASGEVGWVRSDYVRPVSR
ncbi:MAG: LysM peptidoglycan-binding domain-containing protein [Candidatus Schekmanbacteria bacterium]|nr:LysM peptidoglycan-binding domain-containing protein [Candidatus Schekmanbacteria bacterium]